MSPRTRVTLQDISEAVGVSRATVSMILSGRADVSFADETIRNVRSAAERLGYEPTSKKRTSFFGRGTVLIVCPNVVNPYYSTVIQAIHQAAADKAFSTLVHATYRDPESESALLNAVSGLDIAGVIFTMMPQHIRLVERVNKSVPVVVIGDRNASLNVDTVELDNYSAGTLIANHMIELGHRHIAYISTTLNADNSARVRRLEGLRDTFRQSCPGGSVLVKSREITPQIERDDITLEHRTGYDLTLKCLSDKKITAFVAVNDMVAYGVIDAIRAQGYRIPEEYSVCGFDNIFPSQFASIGLTTVEHYMVDKGRNALEILNNKINGSASDRNITRVEFRHHLIIRDSTARPERDSETSGTPENI